ncbi:SDR family NAD(P)-dependent oxidoreductase [Acetobacter okinawensis]|uniref:SDR family NAD(P)-dependent oxidoreductase n=1 Tax=Acetobacter okinawensis TaxID=1076594 RepID=UPI001BA4C4FE|nr:SDR family NAD(P)-dependent oxidoreductase [Acetobacter okinawensis]MBS0966471.1 SDR family NAD(P)-dependent oxidoreductase [Acetobacter okinawensis]
MTYDEREKPFALQHPVQSGFTHDSTAAQVLENVDLHGKKAIVTGGHSGLGLETTRALVTAGCSVIVASRNKAEAAHAVADLPRVTVGELDLADLDSVKSFAHDYLSTHETVDILINNAGIMACPERRVARGWEAQFAVNHLGHYALANYLEHGLRRQARVVVVSSAGHHASDIHWDDLQLRTSYDKWIAYGQSKTANALFAVRLNELGADRGLRAYSLHPGKILTPLQRFLTTDEMVQAGWVDSNGCLVDATFKTPAQGAATQVWAATSGRLSDLGGVYCEDCDVAVLATPGIEPFVGVKPYAIDPESAERLWRLSAELVGRDAYRRDR